MSQPNTIPVARIQQYYQLRQHMLAAAQLARDMGHNFDEKIDAMLTQASATEIIHMPRPHARAQVIYMIEQLQGSHA